MAVSKWSIYIYGHSTEATTPNEADITELEAKVGIKKSLVYIISGGKGNRVSGNTDEWNGSVVMGLTKRRTIFNIKVADFNFDPASDWNWSQDYEDIINTCCQNYTWIDFNNYPLLDDIVSADTKALQVAFVGVDEEDDDERGLKRVVLKFEKTRPESNA